MNLQNFTFILFLLLVGPTKAQVTIGSGIEPVKGALLDLKEQDNTSGGITATKGLGLPRVQLISKTALYPMFTTTSDTTNINYKRTHIGLVVYNMNRCAPFESGLYVWDGGQWQSIGAKGYSLEVKEHIDARDGEVYLYRKLGDAGEWMLENLRYIPKETDGYYDYTHSSISNVANKYYAYSEGDEDSYIPENHPSPDWESYKKNGLLYNWPAAINMGDGGGLETPNPGNNIDQGQGADNELTTGVRGICPQGWHVPSDKEWNDLEREIYNNAHLYSTYTEAEKNTWTPWNPDWETTKEMQRPALGTTDAHGHAMKSPCPPYGASGKYLQGKSLPAIQGGFDVLMAGAADHAGHRFYGNYGFFWSASSGDGNGAHGKKRSLIYDLAFVSRYWAHRGNFYSIRCKKD